jgi:Cys-tRNA(Pro)/Cys-tRNA(Cys) deacylase
MMVKTPVTAALEKMKIEYTLHVHEGKVTSLQQAAEERGLLPEQIVRSLLFRLESQTYVMVLMPGPSKVSWAKLRAHLGVSRMTTATAEQVEAVTGYIPGAVSPFGLPRPLRILADDAILDHELISIGAGIRDAGILLKSRDLVKRLDVEIGSWKGD